MSLDNLLGATLRFLAVKGLLDYQQLLREEKETVSNSEEVTSVHLPMPWGF